MTLGSGIAIAGIWIAVAALSFGAPAFAGLGVVCAMFSTGLVAFSGK